MKPRFLASFIFLSMLTFATAMAQSSTPYVEVSASASREVTPNSIEVTIALNEVDSKGKITIKEQQKKLAKALTNAGVDMQESLVIVSQSSSAAKRKETYQYINYTLTLHSAEELKAVFDEFDAQDVSGAQVQRVSNDNVTEIATELRTEAMQKAQKAAEGLAAAVGQKIGKAILINCYNTTDEASAYSGGMLMRSQNAMADSAESSSALPSDLTLRPIDLRQNVTVQFELL